MNTPEELFWRQLDILPPDKWLQQRVTIIGAGGIGSPTALLLAKMGCQELNIFDFDTVELHNLPNQMYPLWVDSTAGDEVESTDTIGLNKAFALSNLLLQFSDNVTVGFEPVTYTDQPLSPIVIGAVDSMRARQTILAQAIAQSETVKLYIDGRIGGQVSMVYSIDPSNPEQVAWYIKEAMFKDEDAVELPCTGRATMFNGFGIASLIGNVIKKYLMGEPLPKEIILDYVNLMMMVR